MNKKYEMFKENPGDKLYRIRALRDFGDVKKGNIGGFIEKESNLSHDGNCWIHNNSKVYSNAIISDNAEVCDRARIFDHAEVYGYAKVFDHAEVFGQTQIYDCANVCGDAKVYGNAQIFDNAKVYNYATVYGDAQVYNNAIIFGTAEVFGQTQIYDCANVCGNAIVYGNANVCGNAKVYGNAIVYKNAVITYNATVCIGTLTDKVIYMSLTKDDLTIQGDEYVNIGSECHHIDHWIEKYKEICKKNNYSNVDIELYGSILKSIKETLNLNLETIK